MKYLLLWAAVLASTIPCCAQIVQQQPSVVSPSPTTPATRSIEGTVLTKAGAPAPGAIVLLKDSKTLQVRSYIAQDDGKYHFYGLSTEIDYQVRAQANGMTSKIKNVSVFDSHRVVHLNLKLTQKKKE